MIHLVQLPLTRLNLRIFGMGDGQQLAGLIEGMDANILHLVNAIKTEHIHGVLLLALFLTQPSAGLPQGQLT